MFLCRYTIGKVIGAGSFGVVREAVHKKTGVHYACKTIPKMPKKGRGTPRYLLKIQTEVDAMLQLGPSLDAVFLNVCSVAITVWTVCLDAVSFERMLRRNHRLGSLPPCCVKACTASVMHSSAEQFMLSVGDSD